MGHRPVPSPFATPSHPLALAAAEELLAELRATGIAGDEGKMFGVLVAEAAHSVVVTLRAFSGMLGGSWTQPGFAPPLFDPAAWEAMWPAGQASLRDHELALRAIATDPARAARREELVRLVAARAVESEALRVCHRERKAARAALRGAGGLEVTALHALDQDSRGDTAQRRRFDADSPPLAARVAADDAERLAIEAKRAAESRGLMKQVHDSYVIASYRGERRGLRELFAPGEPPGGAGDCAGPKLLGEAYRRGLRPIAMAEVWWGPPPATGGRHAGGFYPACRGKCGPILPFMLEGLDVETAPIFGATAIAADEPRTVFEDDDIVVVDKPIDLLSVPGRSAALRDSVQTRLRARYPLATGPLVVHRLDLETSGLLLAAKSEWSYAALQAQFARREVDKRYIAWLAGDVRGERGVIELPLRVDLDDRPRQIVDAEHGKTAVTEWTVLAREGGRTRVAFVPRTGRTHQLRVHAAVGLGAPIVGDRLYGAAGERLLLHAERLQFVHPRTGQRITACSPSPW